MWSFGGETLKEEIILDSSRSRWEDNIKMDIGGTGWGDMDWIHLIQNGTNEELLGTR
jgi:hypothetical protein